MYTACMGKALRDSQLEDQESDGRILKLLLWN
jgi:hypothetical protein